MQREDELSKQAEKGICGVEGRTGRICTNVKGECKMHAPDELRCASMLDRDAKLRCWLHKQENSDYCSSHANFPNLSTNAKEYGIDCYNRYQPCSLNAFLERYYQNADVELFPFLDRFSAYVKSLSGHHDLWQLEYRTSNPELVSRAGRVVDLLISRKDNALDAAHVNSLLSGLGIPLTVEVTDAGFSIGGHVDQERVEVARLSH